MSDIATFALAVIYGWPIVGVLFTVAAGDPIVDGPGWVWRLLARPVRDMSLAMEQMSAALAEGLRLPTKPKPSRVSLERRITELERELEIGGEAALSVSETPAASPSLERFSKAQRKGGKA